MKEKLFTMLLLCSTFLTSCLKEPVQQKAELSTTTGTNSIVVVQGFTWESSRTVSFTINSVNLSSSSQLSLISIYDGNPATTGKLITKGGTTNTRPFKSSCYITNQVKTVYVVKTAADKSTTTQQVQLNSNKIILTIGG